MPRFVLNTRIQNACFIALKCLGNCTKDRDQVKELERIRSLRLEDMGDIHKCDDPKAYTDPELEERLANIQKQIEEIEYQSMVSDVAGRCHMSHRAANLNLVVPGVTRIGKEYSGTIPGAGDARSFAEDLREANKQATVIINILFSVLGVGFAVFYASYTVTSDVGMGRAKAGQAKGQTTKHLRHE
ncbi:hypothetical protein EV182_000574 [Spiromyces aspiralis]|uniref:Uncharacterized protein n=1 Tax=Spiromyces aspiralis TaxID=68401 RepID=A0ACC1HXU8_9FUNG|nr:hypothetical protein EV182_000574 [Spiromyces aspiralis]